MDTAKSVSYLDIGNKDRLTENETLHIYGVYIT
jgi:hypothetical protein